MKLRIGLAAIAGVAMLAGGGLAAAATTGTAAPAAATTAATSMGTAPWCTFGQLSASFHGYQREMGHRGFLVTLTNISNRSCSLYGYPGLRLENAAHKPLPTTTQWGATWFSPNPGKTTVVLSPGETASADISFSEYNSPSQAVFASYLEVTPPNCWSHFTLKMPNGPTWVYLHRVNVTPMARHTPYMP
jgi:uncharacterized protein DUF4232